MKQHHSNLEEQYNQLKISHYKDCTLTMITGGLVVVSIVECLRAVYFSQPSILLNPIAMIVSTVIILKILSWFGDNQVLIFTSFNILSYFASLYGHYVGDTGYFNDVLDTFHFAFTFSMIERLIVNMIPNSMHKIIYHVLAIFARALIIPIKDKGLLLIQGLILIFTVYFDLANERNHKHLFQSYSQSKEQLEKFKNLVEYYIPEGILILSRDLTRSLFINNAFKELLEKDNIFGITSQLDRFQLRKPISDENPSDNINSDSYFNKTLLTLLQNRTFGSRRNSLSNEKPYYLSFKSTIDAENLKEPLTEDKIFEAKILDLVWDDHSAIGIVFHDITQQQTILQLKIAADANKDRLLATVSHELRTPLNGILGMIQIMYKKIHDQELLQYLKICKSSAHLLLGLVNSILDLNQIRANKLNLNHEKIELQELLRDILSLFEFQCGLKNISLKLKLSWKVPKYIVSDKNRLSQIFINLIGNALKFTNKGAITIKVQESNNSDLIKFTVEDTGIGIKREDRNKLFKMFGRLDQEDSQINQQGVGLGLTISNNLAQLLSGGLEGIQVGSEYGKGSAFSFSIKKNLSNSSYPNSEDRYSNISANFFEESASIDTKIRQYETLPLKKAHTQACLSSPCLQSPLTGLLSISFPTIQNTQSYKEASTYLRQPLDSVLLGPTVLIVDDNPFNITVGSQLVLYQGLNVKSAMYGQIAIDILLETDYKTEPIKLILMDCQMPVMSGFETAEIIRGLIKKGKVPDIPIVALTANDSQVDRIACQKVGMVDYLTKPLTESSLVKIMRKHSIKSVFKS